MEEILKRVEKARDFPANTCGASRHAQMIGEALVRGEKCWALTEEPARCGESILAVVAALYEARTAAAVPNAEITGRTLAQNEADGA